MCQKLPLVRAKNRRSANPATLRTSPKPCVMLFAASSIPNCSSLAALIVCYLEFRFARAPFPRGAPGLIGPSLALRGDRLADPPVEYRRNYVIRVKLLGGDRFRDRVRGGELHRLVYPRRPAVQRTSEDAREA